MNTERELFEKWHTAEFPLSEIHEERFGGGHLMRRGEDGYAHETTNHLWRAWQAALAARAADQASALQRYNQHADLADEPPLERLRAFCSYAMKGQDWLDVEPFFDDVAGAVPADRRALAQLRILLSAVSEVTSWDWSDNDRECLADMAALGEAAGRIEHWLQQEAAAAPEAPK